jgi:ribosome-associated toxin RatA of RatAB toxin-antitoxin module
MKEIRRSALVPATPARMFALINDIERYPDFVPGCADARVLDRDEGSLRARLTVGSGPLRTSFVTRNTLEPPNIVRMTLDEGPFRSLDGVWTLTPVNAAGGEVVGCRVELQLSFELSGGLTALALGPMMERMAGSLVDAFVARGRTPEQAGS